MGRQSSGPERTRSLRSIPRQRDNPAITGLAPTQSVSCGLPAGVKEGQLGAIEKTKIRVLGKLVDVDEVMTQSQLRSLSPTPIPLNVMLVVFQPGTPDRILRPDEALTTRAGQEVDYLWDGTQGHRT